MTDLPRLIRPMLASLRHEFPPDDDAYGWELKWDGLRAIAYVSGGKVRLVSRNDKDMAASYPELAVLAERVGTPVILDGEIVALRGGRPRFRPAAITHARPAAAGHAYPRRAGPDLRVRPAARGRGLAARPALHRAPGAAGGARPGHGPGPHAALAARRRGQAAGREHREGPGGSGRQAAGPRPTIQTSAGTGSRSRTSSSRRSSSAAGNRAKAAARTRSARCCSASTTAASCGTQDMSAPASPRTCWPT